MSIGDKSLKINRLMTFAAAAAALAGFSGASFADAAAGKATFDKVCVECHETADFSGENAKDLAATIEKISAGQMKHKKAFKLSAQEAQDVAAYMTK
jgi:mono/diheme cytochrome c family protein